MNALDIAMRHYLAGVRLIRKEEFGAAEREFREAIKINPRYPEAHRDLGWLLYGMFSKSEDALGYLQTAKGENERLEDIDMYLGIVLARVGRCNEAEIAFRAALARSSDAALAHAVFADYLATQGRGEEAESHFKQSLSLCPDFVIAMRDYARFVASEGRDDEAEELFRKALQISPDDRTSKRDYE